MCRSTRVSASRTAGFTLIEALAALAIVSTGIAAIGLLSFSSLRSDRDVEIYLALVASARSIVAALPQRNNLPDGELRGSIDSNQWLVAAAPFAEWIVPVETASPWQPQRIALLVRGPTGAAIEVETVRLRKGVSR